ncbi:MAG: hypothetical protein EBX02_08425, partial [Betaproteobacteria bacterium]|nr:hypothetical protein [Betaproteobacteria bacterium]
STEPIPTSRPTEELTKEHAQRFEELGIWLDSLALKPSQTMSRRIRIKCLAGQPRFVLRKDKKTKKDEIVDRHNQDDEKTELLPSYLVSYCRRKLTQLRQGKGKGKHVVLDYHDAAGQSHRAEFDRLIVSVGRQPLSEGLGLEAIGLATDERGFIPVDSHCATAVDGVYAIGDVVRGPMLAHKAEDEGVMVAEIMAGQKPHIDYHCVPWVIYTSPEIAWVGRTEQELVKEGRAFKSGQFPFAANGRALGMDASEGFVKMLCDQHTDEILGVHIVAATASDLIAEAALAMEFKASAEDVARVCHPHPSLSEVMREAALAATANRALNI